MATFSEFAMGMANRGKELMVFDWDRAAVIIVERGVQDASAGLAGDWEYTGGPIFAGGQPIDEDDTNVYLASPWATPQLYVDGEYIDCYRMQNAAPEWDSGTYWPDSARAKLTDATKRGTT